MVEYFETVVSCFVELVEAVEIFVAAVVAVVGLWLLPFDFALLRKIYQRVEQQPGLDLTQCWSEPKVRLRVERIEHSRSVAVVAVEVAASVAFDCPTVFVVVVISEQRTYFSSWVEIADELKEIELDSLK